MKTLQTLDRGIEALYLVAARPGALGVAQLGTDLGIPRANAYRLVVTLEAHGLVRRADDGSLWLGGSVSYLAAAFWPGFLEQIRPVLQGLSERASATAFVSIAEREDCIVVATAEPSRPILRVGYRVGSRHPLTRGAAGVAILAARTPADGDTVEVLAARAAGYSVTRGQLQAGAVGVATWVPRGSGTGPEMSLGVVALDDLDVEAAGRLTVEAAETAATLL